MNTDPCAEDKSTPKGFYLVGQEGVPGQGPFMLLVLTACLDRITDAKFQTYPCPAAAACGNFVANWVVGRTVEEVARLDAAQIEAGVGKMPLGREHCPVLAAMALQKALASPMTGSEAS